MATGSAPEFWATTPIARRTRSGWRSTSCPATVAVPESGRARVVRILTVVDLPAPFGQAEDGAGLDGDVHAAERGDVTRIGLDQLTRLDRGGHGYCS